MSAHESTMSPSNASDSRTKNEDKGGSQPRKGQREEK